MGLITNHSEDQAIQRVHRIGQTKEGLHEVSCSQTHAKGRQLLMCVDVTLLLIACVVHVKRFVVKGSVEERIVELQAKKKFLAASVVCACMNVQVDVNWHRMHILLDTYHQN